MKRLKNEATYFLCIVKEIVRQKWLTSLALQTIVDIWTFEERLYDERGYGSFWTVVVSYPRQIWSTGRYTYIVYLRAKPFAGGTDRFTTSWPGHLIVAAFGKQSCRILTSKPSTFKDNKLESYASRKMA